MADGIKLANEYDENRDDSKLFNLFQYKNSQI